MFEGWGGLGRDVVSALLIPFEVGEREEGVVGRGSRRSLKLVRII